MFNQIIQLLNFVVSFVLIRHVNAFDVFSKTHEIMDFQLNNSDVSLFLTPFIDNGHIEAARNSSRVRTLPNALYDIESYSGYLTADTTYNTNLFFWFIPSFKNKKTAPIILWVSGFPGDSSLFEFIELHGPYVLNKDLTLSQRQYTWANEVSLLYIDLIGTGYSYTDDERGFPKSPDDDSRIIYNVLRQFFTIFNEYKENDFYIGGHYYACPYISSLGNEIVSYSEMRNFNLKGLILGNPFCDPINQIEHSEFLYQIGAIDKNQANHFVMEENNIKEAITSGNYFNAYQRYQLLMNAESENPTSYFTNVTGLRNTYNLLHTFKPETYYREYFQRTDVKMALHVASSESYGKNGAKHYHVKNPFDYYGKWMMKSVMPKLTNLLNNYKFIIYSCNLDIDVPVPNAEDLLRNNDIWRYYKEYPNATRHIWRLTPKETDVSGYLKNINDSYFVVVRNAGRMDAYDQPRVMYEVITRFVSDSFFHEI